MFRDPLVLDVFVSLAYGKGLISVVTLSVVVPQAIGSFLRNRIEAVNKSLKSILQRTITQSKTNWHIMLYPALWAY